MCLFSHCAFKILVIFDFNNYNMCWYDRFEVTYLKYFVTWFCLFLCQDMNCSPPGSCVHARISRQEYESTQSLLSLGYLLKPGLLHCRWFLYHRNPQGSLLGLSNFNIHFSPKLWKVFSHFSFTCTLPLLCLPFLGFRKCVCSFLLMMSIKSYCVFFVYPFLFFSAPAT